MNEDVDFASYYDEDEGFNPSATATPDETECVRLVEKSARADGREANLADALIALEKSSR